MRTFALISALFCCSIAAAASPKKTLISIADKASEIQQIWPGFVANFSHAIYHDNGEIYLLSDAKNIKGWSHISSVDGLHIWRNKLEKLRAVKKSFVVNYVVEPGIKIDGVNNGKDAIATLFHESFHGFQNQMVVPDTEWHEFSIETDWIKFKQVEFNLLKKLLQQSKHTLSSNDVSVYIGLRHHRERLMPLSTVALERNMEWQEGVATYVGHQTKTLFEKQSFSQLLNNYGDWLKQTSQQQITEQFMRYDAYFHGAAVTYLLSQISDDWQQAIEAGTPPFTLLEKAIPTLPLDDAAVEMILGKNNTNKQVHVAAFDALDAWPKALIIDGSLATKIGFVSRKIESKSNGNLIHQATKVHSKSRYLELSGRAKKMFLSQKQNVLAVSLSAKHFKKCDSINQSQYRCPAGLTIKASGIKINILQDVIVTQHEKQWTMKAFDLQP